MIIGTVKHPQLAGLDPHVRFARYTTSRKSVVRG